MPNVTPKQKKILDFIVAFSKKEGYSPSLAEIAKHFSKSTTTIHQYVTALKAKGQLTKEENVWRGIQPNQPVTQVFLLGYIAAGQPIEPFENPEPIQVPLSFTNSPGNYYALKVKGQSMVDDGISDGSLIVVKHQKTADNGDAVIAVTEDGATLKVFRKRQNETWLEPRNKNFPTIKPKQLEIRGKFVGVIPGSGQQSEFHELTERYLLETPISHRKLNGQYFTPKTIREALLSHLPKNINHPKVLDPACGTGEFLASAKSYFKQPRLYGWDIESKLVKLTRKIIPQALVKQLDTLTVETAEKFDFVIGNPPYFEFKPNLKLKKKFGQVINGRANIFSFFIKLGLDLLKPNGYLAYVVPPSMNNGRYFAQLRQYIIDHGNIESLSILDNSKLFHQALQSTMLLVIKKTKNKGDYLFKKNGLSIFTEQPTKLAQAFKNKATLYDLGYSVKTGRLVWNQNKHLLTMEKNNSVPLIWAHNITENGLKFFHKKNKYQYVRINNYDCGPAIVTNRITGTVKKGQLKAAIIPKGMKFIAENHVNVIFPGPNSNHLSLEAIAGQLMSKEKLEVLQQITGNTQISKNELEKLFPLNIS